MPTAQISWLGDRQYLAILYNAALYIQQEPLLFKPKLLTEGEEISSKICLCPIDLDDGVPWPVRLSEHYVQIDGYYYMRLRQFYSTEMEKCKSDYKIVHYREVDSGLAEDLLMMKRTVGQIGKDVENIAGNVAKLGGKASGSGGSN